MISLFLRAWLQVGLVALNVVHIANRDFLWAFITGVSISLVWVFNVRTSARAETFGMALAYALGAGVGTVTGMLIGGV